MSSSRPIRTVAGLAALTLLVLTGCGSTTPVSTVATRTVVTERGPVAVPSAPKKIVVLSGGLAGYAFALGAPVEATDTRVLGLKNDASGFPPAWSSKAVAADTTALPDGDALGIEAVAAARPDLILGGGQGFTAAQAEESYDTLAAIAPTVLVPRTVTDWQQQLRLVADAVNRSDRVPALLARYDDRVAAVTKSIAAPTEPAVFLLSLPNQKPFLIPPTAALPALMTRLGFVADDVVAKAGNPPLYGTGDSFELSPELLAQVATAPRAFVVSLGGRTAAQLGRDPLYAALPAFRSGRVHDLPAPSYRPDLDGAMGTLDLIDGEF